MLVRDGSVRGGLNVNWGRESTQKFLSVVILEKTMTVQFLIYVTAAQWDRARLVDVPIAALSQYDRPWSLTNETRVTTYGYRAVQKTRPYSTPLNYGAQSRSRAWSWFLAVDLLVERSFIRFTLHKHVYNKVRKNAIASVMHVDNSKIKTLIALALLLIIKTAASVHRLL